MPPTASPGSPERPIKSSRNDALERGRFVERFVDAIIDKRTRRATGVIVGITGPWGSGKSSVLNLLTEKIESTYPNGLVIRFDPWLVHGRDELIALFIREFLTALEQRSHEGNEWRRAAAALADYADALSSVAKQVDGLFGSILRFSGWLGRRISTQDHSLVALRERLDSRLKQINAPIVVLIDELDRVEDGEVRAVAQLVRAIIDFPRVSYVLAYDHDRVIEALGMLPGITRRRARARGREYLEKIVQYAVPLPTTEREALRRLLIAELRPLESDGVNLVNSAADARSNEIVELLLDHVLQTPRDVKRVVGHFQVLERMTRGEVHEADLLGFAALSSKAPAAVKTVRDDPERYVDDPLSQSEVMRRAVRDREKTPLPAELSAELRPLFEALFPITTGEQRSSEQHALPISSRRALLTVLNLGLSPSDIPRDTVDVLILGSAKEVADDLANALAGEELGSLLDRVEDIYPLHATSPKMGFWRGVGAFLEGQPTHPADRFVTVRNSVRSFTRLLLYNSANRPSLRNSVRSTVDQLIASGEINLVSDIIRLHFFMYGIFKRRRDGDRGAIFTEEETTSLGLRLATAWKAALHKGHLLPHIVSATPLFIMHDTGNWKQREKSFIRNAIHDPDTLDRLVLIMFADHWITDDDYIDVLVGRDVLVDHVRRRLISSNLSDRDDLTDDQQVLMDALQRCLRGERPAVEGDPPG